jgi:hypothetical protein
MLDWRGCDALVAQKLAEGRAEGTRLNARLAPQDSGLVRLWRFLTRRRRQVVPKDPVSSKPAFR